MSVDRVDRKWSVHVKMTRLTNADIALPRGAARTGWGYNSKEPSNKIPEE